jgi:hypothetical protein
MCPECDSGDSKNNPLSRGSTLTSTYCFELQYPLPAPFVTTSSAGNSEGAESSDLKMPPQQPHVWRFGHYNSGASTAEHSTGNRMTAVVVRSRSTRNMFTIFGNGTIVGFGSGDPRDSTFQLLTTVTSDAMMRPAAEDSDFDEDIFDVANDQDDPDDSVIREADELLLQQRTRLLAKELRDLKTFLAPYQIASDPLLSLSSSQCPSTSLRFTTMDELNRDPLQEDGGRIGTPKHQVLFTADELGSTNGRNGGGATNIIPSYAENRFLVLSSPVAAQILPFAFCLAEWLHLKTLERLLIPIAEKAAVWKEGMSSKGKPQMPLAAARKAKAQVLRISSRHGKLGLTRHRLFWESHLATSRGVFHHACSHFEVFTLHDSLKEQLDSLAKTLSYICDEAHEDTNHRLEWIIIALITFELMNAARHAFDHQSDKRRQTRQVEEHRSTPHNSHTTPTALM